MTAGPDLGVNYSYLCFIDTVSGEIMEEGRLHQAQSTASERHVLVFRATEDPPSSLLRLLLIQSREEIFPKFTTSQQHSSS